jgi:hypothetical protein
MEFWSSRPSSELLLERMFHCSLAGSQAEQNICLTDQNLRFHRQSRDPNRTGQVRTRSRVESLVETGLWLEVWWRDRHVYLIEEGTWPSYAKPGGRVGSAPIAEREAALQEGFCASVRARIGICAERTPGDVEICCPALGRQEARRNPCPIEQL